MRICLISREYPPDTGWGGVGVYTFHTANVLSERGHDVHVVSLAGKGNPQSELVYKGVNIHRVEWEPNLDELNLFLVACPSSHFIMKSGIALWKKYLELSRISPFDVVESPEHLAAGIFHAVTNEAPLAVTLHTPHSKFVAENFHFVRPDFDNQLICLLERMAIRQADLVKSPSHDLAGFVASDTGLPLDRILDYKNPVDTNLFRPEGKMCFESNGNVRVLFVGRLEERKGVQILISSIPEVCNSVSNIEFVIVGGDTDTAPGGQSMKAYLQDCLAKEGCLDKVNFVSHIPIEEMPAYYRSGDICVIPSLYDNAPYTCIEALATGKPVVVSDAGGTKEYVQDGATGLIVKKSDSHGLAKAIVELATDENKRTEFGKAAREYALTNLDLNIYATRKEKLYEETIANFNDKRRANSIYGLGAEKSLTDSIDLLCAFDKMIFDTLSNQSFDFRLRYWFRLLKARPKLALLSMFVSVFEGGLKLAGQDTSKNQLIGKLKKQIEEKSGDQFALTRAWASLPELSSTESNKSSFHKSSRKKTKVVN